MFEIFTNYPALFVACVALSGLIVGSFLNVVIHRLPIMLEREWRRDCQQFLGQDTETSVPAETESSWNLIWPGSHCPHCAKPLAVHENIPVLSYLWLRGRCSACHAAISPRYPAVELLSALLSAVVAHRFGPEVQVLPAQLRQPPPPPEPPTILHCCRRRCCCLLLSHIQVCNTPGYSPWHCQQAPVGFDQPQLLGLVPETPKSVSSVQLQHLPCDRQPLLGAGWALQGQQTQLAEGPWW